MDTIFGSKADNTFMKLEFKNKSSNYKSVIRNIHTVGDYARYFQKKFAQANNWPEIPMFLNLLASKKFYPKRNMTGTRMLQIDKDINEIHKLLIDCPSVKKVSLSGHFGYWEIEKMKDYFVNVKSMIIFSFIDDTFVFGIDNIEDLKFYKINQL